MKNKYFKKISAALSITLILLTIGTFAANKANADTGAPVTITATYNSSTGQLDTSGSYAWVECEPGEQTNILGFAVFINDGTPANNNSNALDGAGMHLANSGNPCEVTPDNWVDNSHVLSSAPTNVCVVVYDVRADDSADPGGIHSQIGAGGNYNTDNSWDTNGDSYPEGSCTVPILISAPTPIPTPASTSPGIGGPGDGRSDGLGCASRDCSGKPVSQAVLGASTGPAVLGLSTTSSDNNGLLGLVQIFGALMLSATGLRFFKKNA